MNEWQKKIENLEDAQREDLKTFDKQFDVIHDYKRQLRREIEQTYDIFYDLQQNDASLHNYQQAFERVVDEKAYEMEHLIKDAERRLFNERHELERTHKQQIRQLEMRGY